MKGWRQVLAGLLMASLTSLILLGSISLSLFESKSAVAQGPASTLIDLMPGFLVAGAANERTGEPAMLITPGAPPPGSTLTFTPMPVCTPRPDWVKVIVYEGDTLQQLANARKMSLDELAQGNCLPAGNHILHSDMDVVAPEASIVANPTRTPAVCVHPNGWVYYWVQPGDTLFHLSQLVNRPVDQLQAANCMGSSTYLRPGQTVLLPFIPPPPPPPPPTITRWPTNTLRPYPTSTQSIPPTQGPPDWTNTPAPTHTPPPPSWTETPVPTSPVPTDPVPTGVIWHTEEPTPRPTNPPPPPDTQAPPPTVPPTVPPPPTAPPPPPPDTPVPPEPLPYPFTAPQSALPAGLVNFFSGVNASIVLAVKNLNEANLQ